MSSPSGIGAKKAREPSPTYLRSWCYDCSQPSSMVSQPPTEVRVNTATSSFSDLHQWDVVLVIGARETDDVLHHVGGPKAKCESPRGNRLCNEKRSGSLKVR